MKSLKSSFISPIEANEKFHHPMFNFAKFRGNVINNFCYKLKREHKKISNVSRNLLVTLVIQSRSKCLKLKLLLRLHYSSLETVCDLFCYRE